MRKPKLRVAKDQAQVTYYEVPYITGIKPKQTDSKISIILRTGGFSLFLSCAHTHHYFYLYFDFISIYFWLEKCKQIKLEKSRVLWVKQRRGNEKPHQGVPLPPQQQSTGCSTLLRTEKGPVWKSLHCMSHWGRPFLTTEQHDTCQAPLRFKTFPEVVQMILTFA